MKEIFLDGKQMKTKAEMHAHLQEQLPLPDYYGKNLDALWDVLSTMDIPLVITLEHEDVMLEHLPDYGKAFLTLFEDVIVDNENITFIHDKE